ncbi:extracellular solute-binding protein [Microbacterium sp. SSW1-59]|uniref:extracellular solute-binding protein n=1 Tax=Microbacterium xanthum TaxID=3079794 RepID=UPI002AD36919|nr:extracellular solute-binding protein [Microbacterium sp. SSW1-59]MDZ8200138.1 extracellular solute-binding protein [Microbacterium sp. SSW1-59]
MRVRRWTGIAVAAALAALAGGCAADDGTPVLTWYINPDAGGQARIAEQCTEEADGAYRIETTLLPRDAASQREQLARRLAASDRSLDIMSLDPPFIPELAEPGFLAEVPDGLRDTEGIVQGAVDSASWNDELVTVPFWANTQLLWYRESVVEDVGLDMSQPVTWEQIIEVAEENDLQLGVQGALAESLTVWINALVASAGGEILVTPDASPADIELGLATEEGRAAAEILQRIGENGLGGAGLPTANENASLNLFEGDSGSFMVNWPFVWPSLNESAPDVADDLGWAIYPRVDADTPAAPPVGGINLGVGAFSEHQDLAWQAVECIVQPEHQAEYFVSDGNPPSNAAAYDDETVQEEFPMADVIRESLDLGVPRPQTPYYNEISIGLQRTWHPPSGVDAETTPETSSDFILAVLRGERLL